MCNCSQSTTLVPPFSGARVTDCKLITLNYCIFKSMCHSSNAMTFPSCNSAIKPPIWLSISRCNEAVSLVLYNLPIINHVLEGWHYELHLTDSAHADLCLISFVITPFWNFRIVHSEFSPIAAFTAHYARKNIMNFSQNIEIVRKWRVRKNEL